VRQTQAVGVPLTGTIDKIEFHDAQEVVVVDYKTGKPDPKKLAPPSARNPHGTPYWRQLAFYKILYESFDQSARMVRSGAVTFLDPDASGRFHTIKASFDPEHIADMKALLQDTYQKIMNQEFYQGCGRSDCPWCSFLQRHTPVDSFVDEEVEGLDDGR